MSEHSAPEAGPAEDLGPTPEQVDGIQQAVAGADAGAITDSLTVLHPADAADLVEHLPPDQVTDAVALAPAAFSPDMLLELEDGVREAALEGLDPGRIAAILDAVDSDDAVFLVETLPEDRRPQVLASVTPRLRRDLTTSLAFDEETAGRLTQREVVAAPEHWTVGDAIDHMRAADDDHLPETFFELYVVDPGFRPVGAVALSLLLRRKRAVPLRDVMTPPAVLVSPETDQEDIGHSFNKYHLAQAPVVDEAGRLVGMITLDDVVDVIQEENEEDLLALAGVNEGGATSSAMRQVRARAPWLGLNLVTALAASAVIAAFEGVLKAEVALAILMPIVAGMGGNAGGQALAVAVRAIAARQLTSANARRMVAREVYAGAVNGGVFALLLALAAGIAFQSPGIAAVIAAAMFLNFVCAGLAGILVPLTLKRVGADPAVASSVFVTTITDVVGFFAFLGLATIVLL